MPARPTATRRPGRPAAGCFATHLGTPQPPAAEPLLITHRWNPLPVPAVRPADLTLEAWTNAKLVLLAADTVLHLPAVPSRPGIFMLIDHDVDPAVWTRLTRFTDDVIVLCWPSCRPWLEHQLRTPDPEFLPTRPLD